MCTAALSLVALVGDASTGIACSTTFLVALSAVAFAFSFLVFSLLASACSAAAFFAFMAAILGATWWTWHAHGDCVKRQRALGGVLAARLAALGAAIARRATTFDCFVSRK